MSAQTTGEPEVMRYYEPYADVTPPLVKSKRGNFVLYSDYLRCAQERDAAVRERDECVAREQWWRARRAACYRVVEAAERFRSYQGTASEGEKYAALDNALDAYCATYIEHFFASQRASVDDDYGPNDGYARTANRTPPQDPPPPQEATKNA